MRSVGIICEYNPYHNGHAYQLSQARLRSECDAVVCVMSGSVVQRGEIALYDKWTRARHALQNGADLVVELPAYYVLQAADVFADGAIRILHALGVEAISFGSESGDLTRLKLLAKRMSGEDDAFRAQLNALLAQGLGYPAAYARVLAEREPAFAQQPIGANDMLCASYLRAMGDQDCHMTPIVIKRVGTTHDQSEVSAGLASASLLREKLRRGEEIGQFVPWQDPPPCRDMARLESLLLGFFRMVQPQTLAAIPGIEPGLENRLISAAREAGTLDELWDGAITRRYTRSRVRRVALCALLGIRQGLKLDYIRVLGFTPTGAQVLRHAGARCPLPLIVKTADFHPTENSMLIADLLATDLLALCETAPAARGAGADYKTSPVRVP